MIANDILRVLSNKFFFSVDLVVVGNCDNKIVTPYLVQLIILLSPQTHHYTVMNTVTIHDSPVSYTVAAV